MSKSLIFCIESYSIPAKSSFVTADETDKSGLPTSPKKTVSPEKRHIYSELEFDKSKQELYKVWPGVCNIFVATFPTLNDFPS